MRRIKLDRIDRRVRAHCRPRGASLMSNWRAAPGFGIPPCLRRARALEEAGIIRGYHADLAPEALGYAVIVFAL